MDTLEQRITAPKMESTDCVDNRQDIEKIPLTIKRDINHFDMEL